MSRNNVPKRKVSIKPRWWLFAMHEKIIALFDLGFSFQEPITFQQHLAHFVFSKMFENTFVVLS